MDDEKHKAQNDGEKKFDPRGKWTDFSDYIVADIWHHHLHVLDWRVPCLQYLLNMTTSEVQLERVLTDTTYVGELGGKRIIVIKHLKWFISFLQVYEEYQV